MNSIFNQFMVERRKVYTHFYCAMNRYQSKSNEEIRELYYVQRAQLKYFRAINPKRNSLQMKGWTRALDNMIEIKEELQRRGLYNKSNKT